MDQAVFSTEQTQAYLQKLGLVQERPGLEFLNRLVAAHQTQIAFETITKILDFELRHEYGGFMPPLERHLERMCTLGMGGTCWTLARSFHTLLQALGFEASLAYMDPGHLCVIVAIDERLFYADVGYGAPLFQAYPANRSFKVEARSEVFEYKVSEKEILVSRNPGPVKTFSLQPRLFSEFSSAIEAANDWNNSRFLQNLIVSRYMDGHQVRLVQQEFIDYREPEPVKRVLMESEVSDVLRSVFCVDPELYQKALFIQKKYLPQAR